MEPGDRRKSTERWNQEIGESQLRDGPNVIMKRMFNKSTNINKMKNHLSHQVFKIQVSGLVQAQKGGRVQMVNEIQTLPP